MVNFGLLRPTFSAYFGQLGTQVGLGLGHIVLGEDPASSHSPKGAQPTPPQFSSHICRGQMAAWIKMSLGMEVGLDPGDIVLYRDTAPPQKKEKGIALPMFGPCPLWPNGWMN